MNHHFGNVGDVLKHLVLMQIAGATQPPRYLETHAGCFHYTLEDRPGPIPGGVWDFLKSTPAHEVLAKSSYGNLLGNIAGTSNRPGIYPGSMRCVWEACGTRCEYVASDVDPFARESLRSELSQREARFRIEDLDGVDMVLDSAKRGDLVLIDPFTTSHLSPKHGASADQAFASLIGRGAAVVMWRPFRQPAQVTIPSGASTQIRVDLLVPTGSMDGFEIVVGNIPDAAVDRAVLIATAYGAVLEAEGIATVGVTRNLA